MSSLSPAATASLTAAPHASEARNPTTSSWAIRRRFFTFTVGLATAVIAFVVLLDKNHELGRLALTSSFTLIGSVLAFYTAGAVYEDSKK